MSPRRFLLAALFCAAPAIAKPIAAPKNVPFASAQPTALQPAASQPTALASFVLDLDSSRVLQQKNAHQRLFPASTTKIMTCLVALEHGKLNQIIRAGPNAAATGESGIGLLAGENHTLAELIEAALVHSANDACVAIAEGVGGSQAQFVLWMNQKAAQLGCHDTHFVNPHGLHDPQHFTSAHDLAVIARAALKQPFIDRVARQKTASIGGNWKVGPRRVMINRNKLLFRWAQCDGLKTGYTRQAGNCLVATATQTDPQSGKPWRLLAVTMHSHPGQSFGDGEGLLKRAFASYHPQRVARAGEILGQHNIQGGAFALEATSTRDLTLPLHDAERQTLTRRVHFFPLTAPVKKGAVVGHVEYFATLGGRATRLSDLPLQARDDVPQTLLARALPPVGNRVSGASPVARLLFLGSLCLGAASLLIWKRNHHARRRSPASFRSAPLEPRPADSPNSPSRPIRR